MCLDRRLGLMCFDIRVEVPIVAARVTDDFEYSYLVRAISTLRGRKWLQLYNTLG